MKSLALLSLTLFAAFLAAPSARAGGTVDATQ